MYVHLLYVHLCIPYAGRYAAPIVQLYACLQTVHSNLQQHMPTDIRILASRLKHTGIFIPISITIYA